MLGGSVFSARAFPEEQIRHLLEALFVEQIKQVVLQVPAPVVAQLFGKFTFAAKDYPDAHIKHLVASLLISQVIQFVLQE